jgi:hypothetical protein
MDGEEQSDKKSDGDSLSNDFDFSEPIWVRYSRLQIDTINEGLLGYNAYTICIGGPILYIIFCLL